MKMLKKSAFLLLAAATVASCSQSEIMEKPGQVTGNEEITLRSVTRSATRAAYNGELSTDNPLTALVLGSETVGDYSTIWSNGTMTFTGSTDGIPYNKPLNNGNSQFPTGDKVYLVGLYPEVFGTGGWDLASGSATITLTGKEDIMFAPEVEATKAGVAALQFATLAFEHELTKMDIRFRATEADMYNVTSVRLVKAANAGIKPEASVNLATGALSFAGTAVDALTCYSLAVDAENKATYSDDAFAGNYDVTTDAEYKAYVLAPAVEATEANENEYAFEIVYSKGGAAAQTVVKDIDLKQVLASGATTAEAFVGSTRGYSFSILLSFNNGEINATATVKDWSEGGETIVELD